MVNCDVGIRDPFINAACNECAVCIFELLEKFGLLFKRALETGELIGCDNSAKERRIHLFRERSIEHLKSAVVKVRAGALPGVAYSKHDIPMRSEV